MAKKSSTQMINYLTSSLHEEWGFIPSEQHPFVQQLSMNKGAFFFSYWRIVDLQCSVSYCCKAKWISHMYTYIPSLLDFLTSQGTKELKVAFPLLYSKVSLVIYFIHSINSVCVSIPLSQFLPRHSPPLAGGSVN